MAPPLIEWDDPLLLESRPWEDAKEVIDLLVERGLVSDAALERASRAALSSFERVDVVLAKLGLVPEEVLAECWSERLGWGLATQSDFPTSPIMLDGVVPAFLFHAGVLPLRFDETELLLAVIDPLDTFPASALAAKLGCRVRSVIARPGEVMTALPRLYGDIVAAGNAEAKPETAWMTDVERLKDLASDAPVIKLVNSIIDQAVELRASDIHLTATELGSRVRVRVDGVLQDLPAPPADLHSAVVSRVKIMAGLDIAERRLPQDGRIRISWRGREIDLRIATMPHLHGEGVVLRVLDRASAVLELERLGFGPNVSSGLRKVIAEPSGIFLVTGPTGSGKTTTLYATLSAVARPDRNVITVEDPIEYHLPGVNQIQVHRRIGLDFAATLRAVLRHDPDVIMVGEIRDRETAAVAIQAALTGHLVLATLHTNTAVAALPRLIDMEVEPFLLASTLRGSMAQRLVRKLCRHCRRSIDLDLTAVAGLLPQEWSPDIRRVSAFESVGCGECRGTGYSGRLAIGELMLMNDAIREGVLAGNDETTMTKAAIEGGMRSLFADGFDLVLAGDTTLQEVLRVVGGG